MEMFMVILKLMLLGLVPVIFSAGIRYIEKFTKFGAKFTYWPKQIIIGLIFGGLSIFGSELGVTSVSGAIINIRDTAPICAGLIFGSPAAIISGLIGGLERYLLGSGDFTRVACSVSTVMAGLFAGFIREAVFDNHHGKWYYGLVSGLVIESFHMLMVYVTNMDEIEKSLTVIQNCALPMFVANGLTITAALIAVALISKEPLIDKTKPKRIDQKIQIWLASSIILGLAVVEVFTVSVFGNESKISTEKTLSIGIQDIINEVNQTSDDNLLEITRDITRIIDNVGEEDYDTTIYELSQLYDISEISIIDYSNYITYSTNIDYVGFCMESGDQAREFIVLNQGESEYVQSYQTISRDSSIKMKYAGCALSNRKGFVQVGYDTSKFHKDINIKIAGTTENRHIGQTGYILMYDEKRNFLTGPTYIDHWDIDEEIQNNLVVGELFESKDKTQYIYVTEVEGYYIVGIISKAEADIEKNLSIYNTIFLESIVFFMMYCIIFVLLKHVVINRLKHVNESLNKITAGDLNEEAKEKSSFEMMQLSNNINATVDTLKDYISREAKKIESELQFAKHIQITSLPQTFPPFPNISEFDIYATMKTAKEVGGDFYDFYMVDDNHLAFLVADVSGKGVPAAMFMMESKTIIKSLVESRMALAKAITKANAKLCETNEAQMFVTAFIGILDINTGLVKFVNAGHNPPVIGHADGSFEYIKSKVGLVLAAYDGFEYVEQELKLEKGDQLFLYTDGVTEATNVEKKLYGEDRLINLLPTINGLGSEELCKSVNEDIDVFVGEAEQSDDITMLSLQYNGNRVMKSTTIPADIKNVAKIIKLVDDFITANNLDAKKLKPLTIAVDELVSNVCFYAYPDKEDGKVHVTIEKIDNSVYMTFEDHGIPYNPLEKDDPDLITDAASAKIGGLGIFMVKNLMDDIYYKSINGRNILTIRKDI